MALYFIQSVVGGPIKIGYGANVNARLVAHQIGSPFRLRLLASIDGTRSDECALHKRFDAAHVHGEWFWPTDELCAYLATIGVAPLLGVHWDGSRPERLPRMMGNYAAHRVANSGAES